MRSLLVVLLLIIAAPFAFAAADESAVHKGLKWGVALGQGQDLNLASLKFVGPAFSSYGPSNFGSLAGFLDVSTGFMNNVYMNSSNEYQTLGHLFATAGIQGTATYAGIETYGKVGLNYISADPKLSSNAYSPGSFGGVISFGADFFLRGPVDSTFSPQAQSFFVEFESRLLHKKVASLAGSPDLFNHHTLNVGFRFHY